MPEPRDQQAGGDLTAKRETVERGILRATANREARDAARAKAMHDAEVWPIDGPTWNLAWEACVAAALDVRSEGEERLREALKRVADWLTTAPIGYKQDITQFIADEIDAVTDPCPLCGNERGAGSAL